MLQWADTFKRYGANAALMLNGLYANNVGLDLVADPDPTAGGTYCARVLLTSGSQDVRFSYPSGAAVTMGGACRLWLSALPLSDNTNVSIYVSDIANAGQVYLRIRSSGQITVYTGDPRGTGVIIGTTTIPVITANSWNHVEWKIKIDNSTGTVDIRVNGTSVLSLTGQDTQASAVASQSQFGYQNFATPPNNGNILYVKDLVIWDTTGTYNNNFMGAVQVTDIDTVSDTILTWLPSTGTTGWSILDNNPPVDTTYISAATALSNTFGLGDLPADATSVKGLVLINRSWKIDGGDGNTQMGIISGASTGLGTDRPNTTAPTYWKDVIEVDPATGIPFTPSGFNAASLKQSRTV